MTEREYKRIHLDGYNRRQGGRPITANPYAGKPALRRQADAWEAGWQEAHQRRQR